MCTIHKKNECKLDLVLKGAPEKVLIWNYDFDKFKGSIVWKLKKAERKRIRVRNSERK